MLYLQPCFEPHNWQRSWNNSLQRLVDKLAGVDSFEDEKRNQSDGSLPHGLINTNSSYDTTRNLDSNTSGTRNGGINLVDVSYSDKGGQLLTGESDGPKEEKQITVGEICVPLKEVFYITDMVVINKTLAGKLVKCNLDGSSIMMRASKDKVYDSSEQIQIGQAKIMGFLDVDRLIARCRSNQWETYKIWQAVKNGDLDYTPVTYLRDTTVLKDARKIMLLQNTKFAVVKKGSREVGMLGMARLTETLSKSSSPDTPDDSKDESFYGLMKGRFLNKGGRNNSSQELSQSFDNIANNMSTNVTSKFGKKKPPIRISKDMEGNELSRISGKADVDMHASLDEQDRIDIETISQIEQQNSARTDTSQFDRQYDRNEEYKDIKGDRTTENRLAQSEKVKSSSKSSSYYNYLNNRLSVRIKQQYGKQEPSLAKRLLGSYGGGGIIEAQEDDFDGLVDLENPLLDRSEQ